MAIGDLWIDEEDGTASVPVTFEGSFSGGFSVPWSTADDTAEAGSDYTAATGTLVFSGSNETKYISISILDDSIVEPTQEFFVNLGDIVGDPEDLIQDDVRTGIVGLVNTDTAKVLFEVLGGSSEIVDEGTNGSTTLTLVAKLDNPVHVLGGVQADWATSGITAEDDVDFVSASGTINYIDLTNTGSFTVTILGDTIVELDESFSIELTNLNANGLEEFVTFDDPPLIMALIRNDDQATVSVNLPGAESYDEDAGTVTLGIQLLGRVDAAVEVDIISAAGTASAVDGDYTAVSTHAYFEAYPENTASVQTEYIEIQILDDNWVEAMYESFTVLISNVSADERAVAISGAAGSQIVTIKDNDAATVSIGDVSAAEGTHPSTYTPFVFTVTLSKPVDAAITVDYYTVAVSATAGSDFVHVSTPVTITFQPGQLTKTVLVNVVADSSDDADNETFEVRLTNLLTNGRASVISDDTGVGTIQDDDQ